MEAQTLPSPPSVAALPSLSTAEPDQAARPSTTRRVRIAVAVGVTLVAAGLGTWLTMRRHAGARSSAQYETTKVDRGRLVARVTASGTLSALVTVQVGSQVSGRIQRLFADFNTPVRRGQVIAKIDPELYAAAVEQATASIAALQGQLKAAQATLANAELLRARSRVLRDRQLVAAQDLDTATANADIARGQVAAIEGQLQQAHAALHQARINLAYTDIVSPTDGTVISRNVDVGQTVAAAFQAPTLFVIAEDLRKMQVDTSVAEADIGKLRAGMDASFTVDAYPNEAFRGHVRELRNNPQTVQNVVTYDAVIDVGNVDLRLKPGMTANVVFVYGEKSDVVRIPNAALRFRPPAAWTVDRTAVSAGNDRRTLWALRAGKPVAVPVRIGMSDGSSTELVEGALEVGELLIVDAGGTSTVPPGMRRVL